MRISGRTRKALKALLICFGLSVSAQSFAGTGNGTINPGWNVYFDGMVFFHLSGPHYSPQCPAIPDRWAFDTTTPAGKSMFATFLMAYTTGRSVSVIGQAGAPCIHGNTEPVATIYILD